MLNKLSIDKIPVVILAGGFGTRIADVKKRIPKGLVKIGNYPIIHHIIKIFKSYGYKKFIICTGYKKNEMRKYFYTNKKNQTYKDLDIDIVYTGLNSNTGLRIRKINSKIQNIFFLTYCDGLIDLDLKKLMDIYLKRKKLGVMTVINPQSRFGIVSMNKKNIIKNFDEKKILKNLWVNAGFYIFNKKIFNYLKGKNPIFESEILKKVSKERKLVAYKHNGFWKCMDTIKDKIELDDLWNKKNPPWKVW